MLNKPLEKIGKWGSGYYLCSKHFEPSQFTVPNEKKRLNWNAVPTLFDVPNPPPSVTIKRKLPYRIPAHKVKSIKLEDERVTCHPIPTHSPPKLSPQEWKKKLRAESARVYRRNTKLRQMVCQNKVRN